MQKLAAQPLGCSAASFNAELPLNWRVLLFIHELLGFSADHKPHENLLALLI